MMHVYLLQGASVVGYYYLTVLYPMYQTFRALDQEKAFAPCWTRILTYWLIFATLLYTEPLFSRLAGYVLRRCVISCRTTLYKFVKGALLFGIIRRDDSYVLRGVCFVLRSLHFLVARVVLRAVGFV